MIRRKMKAIAAVTVLSLGLMVPGAHMWTAGTETGAEEEVLLEVEAPDTVAEESSEAESTAVETDTVSETEAESETVSETVTAEETTADAVTVTEVEPDTEEEETEISETEEVSESQLLIGAGDDQSAEPVEEPTTDPAENEADSEKEPMLLGKTTAYSDVESAALVVREGMKNRQNTVTLSYVSSGTLTEADAIKIGNSIYNKAIAHTGVPDEGDYLKWHRAVAQQVSVQDLVSNDTSTSFTLVFSFEYTSDLDEEAAVDQAAAEVMETLALDQYETDYEKVYAIYDHICSNVSYWEYTVAESAYYILSHSAYAAFVEHEAVCQGYALMFYRLALTAGIDNRLISGYAEDTGVAHGWNIVKIGDKYYEVDATWDAGKQAYDYFLLGSERFENTNHQTHSNYTNAGFNKEYPLGLTYVFPNGEPHTHITGWKSDGNGMEDTHHSWCYLCGETEEPEPHTWDEGQDVTFWLGEGETFDDVDTEELLAGDEEDGDDEEFREVTARVYTCEKCGEMHIEEIDSEPAAPEDNEEEETGGQETETEEMIPGEIADLPETVTPVSESPDQIDLPSADQEDDEPVLLDQKTPRQLPKTKAPENKPVETSDPTQLGADVFMMITMFGIMAACLPMMLKKRKL